RVCTPSPSGLHTIPSLPTRKTRSARRTEPAVGQIPHQQAAPQQGVPQQPAPQQAAPAPADQAPSAPTHPSAIDEASRTYGSTAGGLPKRRRRQPTAQQSADDWPTAVPEPDTGAHRVRSAEETAHRMG
ncbi:ATP-binding protein, partial [Streptomyces sp. MCAF7]